MLHLFSFLYSILSKIFLFDPLFLTLFYLFYPIGPNSAGNEICHAVGDDASFPGTGTCQHEKWSSKYRDRITLGRIQACKTDHGENAG